MCPTGVGWHFLLQGIFLTQGLNLHLLCLLLWQVDFFFLFFFIFYCWTKQCNKLGHLWLCEDYSHSCNSPLIGHFMNYLGDDLAGHFMNPSSGGLAVRANIVRWKRKLLLHSFIWATVPWAYPLRGPGQQRILAKDTLGPNRTTHSYSATNQVCDWSWKLDFYTQKNTVYSINGLSWWLRQ